METLYQQRFGEVNKAYLGDTTAALSSRQMLACLAGAEAVAAVLSAEVAGAKGLAAITDMRILFVPLDEGDATAWQRSSLVEAEVVRGGAAWDEVWRIGWPPESVLRLHYGRDRVLTLTAPPVSSVSRDLGDQYAGVVADMLQDGARAS